ncbi:MAG: uL15m family ribosomal protein, partial [Planctomycetota bacterium]
RDTSRDVKVLGDLGREESGKPGTLSVKLTVNVGRVSTKARAAIESAGGSVHESGTRRDRVRGIDRNSDDKTPKNLTKKLRRLGFGKGGKKS